MFQTGDGYVNQSLCDLIVSKVCLGSLLLQQFLQPVICKPLTLHLYTDGIKQTVHSMFWHRRHQTDSAFHVLAQTEKMNVVSYSGDGEL